MDLSLKKEDVFFLKDLAFGPKTGWRRIITHYGKIDVLWYDGEWIPGIKSNRTLIEQGKSSEIAKY